MLKIVEWSFTEGTDLSGFEDHQAGDGAEKILTFLNNNSMIVIATAKRFRDWVCSCSF